MKTLPTFYYLDHFLEMLSFVKSKCWHLLDTEQQDFVEDFHSWERPLQCTLIRVNNRKSPFIDLNKFAYEEIANLKEQLQQLESWGYVSPIPESQKIDWLKTLTKPHLHKSLVAAQKNCPPKSAKRDLILQSALEQLLSCAIEDIPDYDQYKWSSQGNMLDYFRFLFFGNLRSGHEQFSMRDLGITRTRKDELDGESPFTLLEEAQNSFFYRKRLRSLVKEEDSLSSHLDAFIDLPKTVAEQDKIIRDSYLYELGKATSKLSMNRALEIWDKSDDARSVEKWCRESYKLGDKEAVEDKLRNIIDDPSSLDLAIFAKDFYQLKYNKQRRSEATKMLLKATQNVQLDEAFVGSPEKGVQQLWNQQGKQVFRTENKLWRSLFGLTFFELLYRDPKNKPANAFGTLPVALTQNTFYENSSKDINTLLNYFEEPKRAIRHLTKMATQFYGEKNAIFNWSKVLLDRLTLFLNIAPKESVKAHLEAMCRRYAELKDGYPDLMVIDEQELSFVEIKAPNDSIRRNQIRTIQHLNDIGFNVEIATVSWSFNPEQKYCVVDIETTGGQGTNHRITEIGIATIQQGEIIDTWQSLINPTRHIPAHITRLTGIDNAMVADAPVFAEIAEVLRDRLNDSIFVAHNVNFDFGFIKAEFERLGQHFSMPKLCTVREMRKYYPGHSSYSLGSICKEYDIELHNHHRALDDAIAAANLLLMVNEKKQQSNEISTVAPNRDLESA